MSETTKNSVELPVFDISEPLSPSSISSLSLACKEWGFFHITNHGISKDLYNKLYSVSKSAFNLPDEVKIKAGPSSSVKSYTPHFIASPFFESLLVSGPDFFGSAQSSAEVLFDHPDPEFSKTLKRYGNKVSELSNRIVKLVLMSFGEDFPSKFYESDLGNCHGYMRINNYAAPESVGATEPEGLGMHTDMSCVTIVYQDEIGGLQVRSKEGKWMDINPCEDTLVVNIGDLMHAWSNGKLRSSEHRVVLRQSNMNRFSLDFFWCFEDEKVISAPSEVVGEEKRMYKPFVCSDYIEFRHNSEKGTFDKVGFTVKDFAGNASQVNCGQ